MLTVAITSHFEGRQWTGEVDLTPGPDTNEDIFRLFNRVTMLDAERLARWGYNLPSLSVGDVISYNGRAFKVASFGFEEVIP